MELKAEPQRSIKFEPTINYTEKESIVLDIHIGGNISNKASFHQRHESAKSLLKTNIDRKSSTKL
jgi:hypothetical protein